MRLHSLFLCLVVPLLPLLTGAVRQGDAATATRAVTSASAVAALMRSDGVARLEVFCFPADATTLTAMTPESLEAQSWYRIDIRQFQWSAMRAALIDAVEASHFAPSERPPDCRWGCVFYDGRNTRVLTMYFDGAGRLGLINGDRVTGISQLVSVLEARCSRLWEGEVKYHPLAG